MLRVIVEGCDNSGKSTLARRIANYFHPVHIPIIASEGKEKYENEVNERIARYNWEDEERGGTVIYDRHPCVSQSIYSRFNGTTPVAEELLWKFYDSHPLLIYCRDRGLVGHVEKGHDTPEHLQAIHQSHNSIAAAYKSWAHKRANIFYRVGDKADTVAAMIAGVIFGKVPLI